MDSKDAKWKLVFDRYGKPVTRDKKEVTKNKLPNLSDSTLRKWLTTHAKTEYIDFTDENRKKYRDIFNALDEGGDDSIGVEELEDPLIAFGKVNSRDDVIKLIKTVDVNGDLTIDFNEFLLIMKSMVKKKDNGAN
jgi:Ca2+-binding EF-hand superfamily protein